MDPVLADKILEVLVTSYNAIGSRDLADKIGAEEDVVVRTIYEIKSIEVGLFSVTSGIGNNIKELQPLVSAIRDRLDSGGFAKLYNETGGKIKKADPTKVYRGPKIHNTGFKKKVVIAILIVLLIAALALAVKQFVY